MASLGGVLKFGLVGCSGLVVNSVGLVLLHGLMGLPLLIATPLAVEAAIINNFRWNNRWTFAGRETLLLHAFLKYNVSCLAGLVICTVTLQVLVASTSIHYLAANMIGIILAAGSNFLLSSRWAWRNAAPSAETD